MSLTVRILIGMVAGFLVGSLLHVLALPAEHGFRLVVVDGVFYIGGQIFLNSLKLLVVPLVLVSIVCGASNISDGATMGRVGGKALGLYLLTTAIAITLALSIALLVGPGTGIDPGAVGEYAVTDAPSLRETIIDIFPSNPVASMAEGQMLQIIVFALLLGVAVAHAGRAGQRVKSLFEDFNDVIMKLVTMLIALAPYGVFCLMATMFTDLGWSSIAALGAYFLTVAGVLVLHALVVYPTLLAVLGRVSPLTYMKKMREPMMVAFSTSSSGATLPVTLETVEKRVGVRNEVASFVIPLGATINMDGTAIMQGVATVFIAQAYGIPLDLTDYMMVILTATMASIGTAGVPGVGLIMLTMVLAQVGLPAEGIAMIIGVDRLLDMMRTVVNITGDGTVATIVGRSEGKLDLPVFDDPSAGDEEEQQAFTESKV
ncbi:MAG: dicarboxylate/amino acid:cation symporter [Pseudomonadales bacterium]|jgi:Na+/H+-dicarboxylate symporter|nr:dicarboxylate/amino acid:cation symporter [Pseudomonadales bacterium]